MTVTYSNQVSSVKLLGLVRLLRMWRASVYKLVFREILIFLALYFFVSCVYRYALNETQKKMFERLVLYTATSESVLPVTFILGFYVSVVVQRWWSQFCNIGWPDRIMAYISVLVVGQDEHSRMIRRTMIRYLMLSEVLLLMNICAPVKKRFPTLESLVEQGLMTKEELKIYNDDRVPHNATKYWIPCQWCAVLMGRARDEKKVRDSFELIKLLEELTEYKNCLKAIFTYDWVSLPLVYTQVATLAVYAFFFTAVISRQFISFESVRREFDEDTSVRYAVDMYVPLEAIIQLFFYLGWLKVAEQMLNPFGEDDDDFECNFIIDRNLKVGLYSVDKGLSMQPRLQRDAWWDSEDPTLGYTEASKKFAMVNGWFGSTANLAVPVETSLLMQPQLPSMPEATSDSMTEPNSEETLEEVGAPANSVADEAAVHDDAPKSHGKSHIFVKRGRRRAETTAAPGTAAGRLCPRRRDREYGSTPDNRACSAEADDGAEGKQAKEIAPLVH